MNWLTKISQLPDLPPLSSLPPLSNSGPVDVTNIVNSLAQNQITLQEAERQLTDPVSINEACLMINMFLDQNVPGKHALIELAKNIHCEMAQQPQSQNPQNLQNSSQPQSIPPDSQSLLS